MVRILVVGEPSAALPSAHNRLLKLSQASGPFSLILLTHPPIAAPSTLSPLSTPVYFAAQEYASSPTPREVAPNVHYVGPAAHVRAAGLSVLLLAGGYDDPATAAPLPDEVRLAVREAGVYGAGFAGLDVLVTGDPARMDAEPHGSSMIARLGDAVRPRYHFWGADFDARVPFVVQGAAHGTRVVTVAKAAKGARWVYAADVAPLAQMRDHEKAASRGAGRAYWRGRRWGDGESEREEGHLLRVGKRGAMRARADGKRRRVDARDQVCWFCLSNGREGHLVVHVGEHVYVALAKGGVNERHLLIVGVAHVRGSAAMTEDGRAEMARVIDGVRAYYRGRGDVGLFWECCVGGDGGDGVRHVYVEAVPVGKGDAFEECARRVGVGEVREGEGEGAVLELVRREAAAEYVWAEVGAKRVVRAWGEREDVGGERGKVVRMGRNIAVEMLALPERRDWRRCVDTVERQQQLAGKVRAELGAYLTR